MTDAPSRSPSRSRSPAPAEAQADATYPTLAEHAEARRLFLKRIALAAAATSLGLPLVGCPSGSGNGSTNPPGWVPWGDDEQVQHLAGAAPMSWSGPVAVVIGGGPVEVTFQDGAVGSLVIAAVASGPANVDISRPFTDLATKHAEVVRQAAAKVPSSVLTDAAALQVFEDGVRDAIRPDLSGKGIQLDEVSAATAAPDAPPKAPDAEGGAAAESAPSAPAAPAPAAAPAPPSPGAASAPAASPPRVARGGATTPGAGRLWSPCRKPGCTSCGPR